MRTVIRQTDVGRDNKKERKVQCMDAAPIYKTAVLKGSTHGTFSFLSVSTPLSFGIKNSLGGILVDDRVLLLLAEGWRRPKECCLATMFFLATCKEDSFWCHPRWQNCHCCGGRVKL